MIAWNDALPDMRETIIAPDRAPGFAFAGSQYRDGIRI